MCSTWPFAGLTTTSSPSVLEREMPANPWTREQLLVALRLYLTEPFGRLHKTNPLVKALAAEIGRSPSALSMKACNFASLDPTFRATGRAGLSGASAADKELWGEYASTTGRELLVDIVEPLVEPVLKRIGKLAPTGPDEVVVEARHRRHQRFFREELHAAYGGRCAVTGLDVPALLVASHIIPWHREASRRVDPSNGILLNALLDRAFDRGLIGFDDDFRVICSSKLRGTKGRNPARDSLVELSGQRMSLPERTPPDSTALRWHRNEWHLGA